MVKILITPGLYEQLWPSWYRDAFNRIVESDPMMPKQCRWNDRCMYPDGHNSPAMCASRPGEVD